MGPLYWNSWLKRLEWPTPYTRMTSSILSLYTVTTLIDFISLRVQQNYDLELLLEQDVYIMYQNFKPIYFIYYTICKSLIAVISVTIMS